MQGQLLPEIFSNDVEITGGVADCGIEDTPQLMGEGAFWRPLDPLEKRADMAESRKQTLTLSEKHGPAIAKAIGALVDDVKKRAAKLPASAAAIRQLAPTKRLQNELSDAVSAMMADGYAGGQRKAATEIRAAKRAPAKFSETQTNVLAAFEARGGLVGSRATQFFANKALFVTGLTVDDILKRAQLVLFNSLKQDKTPGQVMFEVDQALGDYLPEEDAAGNVVNVPARVETIVNTNLAEAWNEGRWAAFTDPDLEGFISMVRYSAVMDDRTRATHAAWDGVTRPVDDPVWFGPPDERPPNGYNCRCTLVPISVADNAEETPDDALPSEPAADTNFK